ncbi:MAG TPA: DEAD/DEAH box helicase family protein, partial [Burkholderiales bacterium]|nr:DEAD/DEAH box helicase family protein [Burkholderiales bacterium]
MAIARVALDVPLETLFDYRQDDLALVPGQLVVVPFGRRRQVGVVVELVERSEIVDARLRRIERALPVGPLPQELLALIRFCSDYYHYPFGQAVLSALPVSFRRVGYDGPKCDWEYALTSEGRRLRPEDFPRAAAKRRLLAALSTSAVLGQVQARALFLRAPAVLTQWIGAGWVERHPVSAGVPVMPEPRPEAAPKLTSEQFNAVEKVTANFGKFSPWLLHGVTGSGKTEVYFRLIEAALGRSLQSLLMVPEINLTPQLEALFLQRFPGVRLV